MKCIWLILVAFLLAALGGSLASPAAAQQTPINSYTAVDLGHLGGGGTTAYGLNDAGHVVGESLALVNGVSAYRAFLWQSGVMTNLGTLGGSQSRANAVNNSGQVVGWASTAAGATYAFLWDAGTGMRDLGTLGGVFSEAYGVNDAGQVVGTATTAAGPQRAFLWQNGRMVDLGTLPGYTSSRANGINASGQVAGYATDAYGNKRAFRWTPSVPNGTVGTMVALHVSNGNIANAINGFGDAVGESTGASGFRVPTHWNSGGGAYDLPILSDMAYGFAYAINDSGQVVGQNSYDTWDDYGNYTYNDAFLWDSVNGTRRLSTLIGANAYYVVEQARGINAFGQVAANGNGSASLLNPSPVPARPTGLWAGIADARVSLSWTPSSGSASYNVKRATTSGGPYTIIASVALGTTYTDTAVVNGSTYYYVVSAVNEYGESADSDAVSATPMPPPGAPTGLTATAGDQQVSLSWNASAGAGYYEVYRSTTPGGPYEYLDYSYAAGYGDYWVENGTTYYYVVTAVNLSGQSAYSNEASATPMPPPPPPAPTGLAASAGDRQVSLTWNASAGANYYIVKWSTASGGPYTRSDSTGGTAHTVRELTNGTTYYFVVSAVNSGGESPDSTQVSATPFGPPPPTAPTGLSATAGKRKVSLKWAQSATAGVTQNRVYRSTTSGGPYSLRATLGAGTSYADTSVTSGVTYHYRVTALKSGQESAYSNQASARPR